MSTQDNSEAGSSKQASEEVAQTPASEASDADQPASNAATDNLPENESQPRRRGGLGLIFVALIALVALALALHLWFDATDQLEAPDFASSSSVEAVKERLEDGLAGLSDRLDRLEQMLETAAGERESLASRLDQAALDRDALSERIERQSRELETLESEVNAQLQELWQQEGQQREVDRELERRLRLLEAASLLRFGQERAELAGDWPAARSAYERAERLVRAVDDPRLGQVRRLLAAEMDSLEAAREPEWERWQVRLDRIAASTADWPLRARADAGQSLPDSEPETTGWLADMRSALGRLFTVSRRDELALPDEVLDGLREQLRLRLVAAELALVRRNLIELGHQLGAAQDLVERWFDTDDADVREASERLGELRSLEAARTPEGLGEALRALQSHLDSA